MDPAHRVEGIRFQPDWQSYPAVVIESDDWGACEQVAHRALWQKLRTSGLLRTSAFAGGTLEHAVTLRRLQRTLEGYRGPDGLPAVITAFACLANPDYARIRRDGFQVYHDIPIDCGFPSKWRRPGLHEAWADAMQAGVFHPEFHTRLHHTHPGVWLEYLRKGDKRARALFEHQTYVQGGHIPEYQDMNPAAQHHWVKPAVDTFIRWTGGRPTAGVTSDATAMTEIIWRAHGIRTFCLRNFRNERGEVIVYPSKPWNNQNPYTPMGGWNAQTDTVYLRRNVDFECGWKVDDLAAIVAQIQQQWDSNEPAILNTHRVNWVHHDPELEQRGWQNLQGLLEAMAQLGGVRFLTSGEVGDIYRQGWSVRKIGGKLLLRVLGKTRASLPLHRAPGKTVSLTGGKISEFYQRDAWHFQATPGDYLLSVSTRDSNNPDIAHGNDTGSP